MIEKVKSLTLGVFKLEFSEKQAPEKILPDNTLVEDFGYPLDATLPWQPQWVIKGWYHKINHGAINRFIIDDHGPNILYITGLPSGVEKEQVNIPTLYGVYQYTEAWKEDKTNTRYIIIII